MAQDCWQPFQLNPLDLVKVNKHYLDKARIVPSILLDNGYDVILDKGEPFLVGPCITPFRLGYGFYNLWFLLQWVEWSTGSSYLGGEFSFCSGIAQAKTPAFETMGFFRPKGTTYWDYSERDVAQDGIELDSPAPWFLGLDGASSVKSDDVIDLPGVWKIDLKDLSLEERQNWKRSVQKNGYSFYRHPTKAEMFFTNASGINKGMPPTASMLGLPKLVLGDLYDQSALGAADDHGTRLSAFFESEFGNLNLQTWGQFDGLGYDFGERKDFMAGYVKSGSQ